MRSALNTRILPLFVLACALFVGLVVFASPGLRGSDQYWYAQDVTTLASTGHAQSFETYPFSLVGPHATGTQTVHPPIHNLPVLWVWAAAMKVVGNVHWAMLMTNLAFLLSAAVLVFASVSLFAEPWVALLAAALALFVPIGFWNATQDLSEAFSTLLVALALWVLLRRPASTVAALVSGLVFAFAAVNRAWVLPMIALPPLALLLLSEGTRGRRWGPAVAIGAASGVAFLAVSKLFPGYQPDLGFTTSASFYGENMQVHWYKTTPYAETSLLTSVLALALNALKALVAQVWPFDSTYSLSALALAVISRWPILLAEIFIVVRLFRDTDRLRRLAMLAGLIGYCCYLAMCSLWWIESRYLMPVLPAILSGFAAAVAPSITCARGDRRASRRLVAGLVATAIMFAATDVALATYFRRDVTAAAVAYTRAAQLLSDLPSDARLVADLGAFPGPSSYATYPHLVLRVDTQEFFDAPTYRDALTGFGATHLITHSKSKILSIVTAEKIGANADYALYRIRPNNAPATATPAP